MISMYMYICFMYLLFFFFPTSTSPVFISAFNFFFCRFGHGSRWAKPVRRAVYGQVIGRYSVCSAIHIINEIGCGPTSSTTSRPGTWWVCLSSTIYLTTLYFGMRSGMLQEPTASGDAANALSKGHGTHWSPSPAEGVIWDKRSFI